MFPLFVTLFPVYLGLIWDGIKQINFLCLSALIVETDAEMVFKMPLLLAMKKAYGLVGQAGTEVGCPGRGSCEFL